MSIRLLIADGHELARAGMKRFVVDTEIEVVAEAAAGNKAVQLAAVCKPDVVLLAVRMPVENGFAALKRIKQRRPEVRVILTANEHHSGWLAQAHTLGASAYLVKDFDRESLLRAVRAVAAGQGLWDRELMRRVTGVLTTPRLERDIEAPLTPREGEVLRRVADGKTNQQIGEELGISYETVKEHVQHLLRKIGVQDRTQAAIWAVRNGLG